MYVCVVLIFFYMFIKSAKFVISNQNFNGCPEPDIPEYAFIGRSNVGKSSLINMLIGKQKLAKTSNTPGKTRLINHFIINDKWYLVDLPGLGFAKTSKKNRTKWEYMIYNYFLKRKNLLCTLFLIDSRHNPQKIDTEFINWFGSNHIPFIIVFTKTDKLTKNQLNKNIKFYKDYLLNIWEELPKVILSSTKTQEGKYEILDFIENANKIFR